MLKISCISQRSFYHFLRGNRIVFPSESFIFFAQNMTKIAIVIANHGFQDLEFWNPFYCFQKAGFEVEIFSGKGWDCIGAFGKEVKNTKNLKELHGADFDGVVFVGWGWAYEQYTGNEEYFRCAREAKMIGAICIAPSLIAESGLFRGKKITGRDDGQGTEIDIIQRNGAIFIDEEVVKDGNVITANGPQVSLLFGEKIVAYFS